MKLFLRHTIGSKPLIRWTIGSNSKLGFFSLSVSVKQAKKIFGTSFDYAICYNNLNKDEIKKLPKVDIYVNCHEYKNIYSCDPPDKSPAWKLYPPRLRLKAHEICMDNDLILYKKPNCLKLFFQNDYMLITESYKRSYHGILDEMIPPDNNFNSGFLCLKPDFDYQSYIKNTIEEFDIKWNNHFVEQTLVSYIISKQKHLKIKTKEIYVCADKIKMGASGIHLVGLNSKKEHGADFLKQLILG
jgi:hypothetical protein